MRGGKAKSYRDRSAERYATEGLTGSGLPLLDLSAGGMRVAFDAKAKFRVGENRTFIVGRPGAALRLAGVIVWVKRKSVIDRSGEAGVQFVGLSSGHAKAVDRFARLGTLEPEEPAGDEPGSAEATAADAAAPVRVDVPDFYAIVGVARSADEDAIKSAYRKRARELHPDLNPDPEASERFDELTKAYTVLSDRVVRERYDAMLSASQGEGTSSAAA
ncbi:MAG: DnaJ domain-containing protein [Planctomycetota bacterium]